MRIVENGTGRIFRRKDERTREQVATVDRVGAASGSALFSRARISAEAGRVMSM
jgi:hypothetical protein